MGSLNPPRYFLEIEMALKVDAIGVVVLPPKKKVNKKGVTFWELVVNFGENSRADWYVRVWSASDKSLVPFMRKDTKIRVVGKIAKWSVGAGYGVAIDADEVKTDLSDSNKTSKKL